MLVPGGNILGLALRVINPQGVVWQRWTGRTRNAGGSYVNAYAATANITGSFQPIDRKAYVTLGLDMSRNYATFHTNAAVQVVTRDTSGDLLTYGGKLYQIESKQDWSLQDGWSAYTCVEVGTV